MRTFKEIKNDVEELKQDHSLLPHYDYISFDDILVLVVKVETLGLELSNLKLEKMALIDFIKDINHLAKKGLGNG